MSYGHAEHLLMPRPPRLTALASIRAAERDGNVPPAECLPTQPSEEKESYR